MGYADDVMISFKALFVGALNKNHTEDSKRSRDLMYEDWSIA